MVNKKSSIHEGLEKPVPSHKIIHKYWAAEDAFSRLLFAELSVPQAHRIWQIYLAVKHEQDLLRKVWAERAADWFTMFVCADALLMIHDPEHHGEWAKGHPELLPPDVAAQIRSQTDARAPIKAKIVENWMN